MKFYFPIRFQIFPVIIGRFRNMPKIKCSFLSVPNPIASKFTILYTPDNSDSFQPSCILQGIQPGKHSFNFASEHYFLNITLRLKICCSAACRFWMGTSIVFGSKDNTWTLCSTFHLHFLEDFTRSLVPILSMWGERERCKRTSLPNYNPYASISPCCPNSCT